jgi:putative ABC transport system substrate-binding protein
VRRRDFTAALLLGAATRPAWAQALAKQHRIVFVFVARGLANWREGPLGRVFFAKLRHRGYAEGDNLIVEGFSADGHPERYADAAQQAVNRNPDVIVAADDFLVKAVRLATDTIPIVAIMGDPLNTGLVTSLTRRPGDNLTGISDAGGEIWGKRLQILREAIPSASRIGLLLPPGLQETPHYLREAGTALGVSLIEIYLSEVTGPEIKRSFAALAEQQPDAVLISPAQGLGGHNRLIVSLAEAHHLPAMYEAPIFAEAGGLMT